MSGRSLSVGVAAILLASCSPEGSEETSVSSSSDGPEAVITTSAEANEWPFEECDPAGNDFALAACALDELEDAEDQLAKVVERLRESSRAEALLLGVTDDPEDPEKKINTNYSIQDFIRPLDDAQAAWVELRTRQCEWETAGFYATQGSIRTIETINCKVRLTEQRIAALKAYEENDESGS